MARQWAENIQAQEQMNWTPTGHLPGDIGEERRLAISQAVKEMETLAQRGLELRRYVFFVPGWTGENAASWLAPYTKRNLATKVWIDRVFRNADQYAVYVDLTKESPRCHSFCDFGNVVREKVGDRTPCDCVGHSMGGLDIAASIALCKPPLLNVKKLVTFGSPLRGTEWGEIRARMGKLLPHHKAQAESMDPDQPFVKQLQSPAVLQQLLDRVESIYCLYGTRDMAIRRSGRIDYKDIDPNWQGASPGTFRRKVRVIDIQGAEHTGRLGITQDPRAILWLVRILADLELPEKKLNHGYIFRR